MSRDLAFITGDGKYIEARALVDDRGNSQSKNGYPLLIGAGDGPSVDAFSRFRVSNLQHLYEHSNILIDHPSSWNNKTEVGGTIVHQPSESLTEMSVTTAAGSKATRQATEYSVYFTGKGQLILQTFVFSEGKENLRQRAGYFDSYDGLFLEQESGTNRFVIRSSTSGVPVDVAVAQSNWNLDKLDGTGRSEIELDLSKTHILIIDFQWLGVGRVRFGFDIDGQIVYAHEQLHANSSTLPYMANPNLPIRYEIENLAATASPSTLKEICASVSSEGGDERHGLEFSVDMGIAPVPTSTVETTILILRLQKTVNGRPNRIPAKLLSGGLFNSGADAVYRLKHLHNPEYRLNIGTVTNGPFVVGETITGSVLGATGVVTFVGAGYIRYRETNQFLLSSGVVITGGTSGASATITAATTWNVVDDSSIAEYSISTPGVIGEHTHTIDSIYTGTAAGNKPFNFPVTLAEIDRHRVLYQNEDSVNSQAIVVTVQTLTGAGSALAALSWLE